MRIFIFFLLLLANPSASAYDGIFSVLDESYVDNVSALPLAANLKPDETLTPGNDWFEDHCTGDTQNNCVFGWFDIVGFRDTVRHGDAYFIKGDPADSSIILYKTYVRINGRYLFKDWIYDLQKYETNGNFCARLTATAVLYQIDSSGYISYDYPSQTFQKCIPVPKQYPELHEPTVIITQYNNSLYENIGIKILGDNYTKITINYKDKHAERTFHVLHVETNEKGIVYGNLTALDQWKIEGTGISRYYNEILQDGNLSQMNLYDLDIRAYNAFTSVKASPDNFTILRAEFVPGHNFTALFFGFIGVVGVLFYGSLFLLRRLNTWHIKLF